MNENIINGTTVEATEQVVKTGTKKKGILALVGVGLLGAGAFAYKILKKDKFSYDEYEDEATDEYEEVDSEEEPQTEEQ